MTDTSLATKPPEDAARARLVVAIESAARVRNFNDGEMREAAHEYARLLRANGTPPERLIIGLKEMVQKTLMADMRDWFRSVLTDRIVVWGIEGYYGLENTIAAKDFPPG